MPTPILGRGDWTSRLRSDVERTVTGHGGLLLITGEAGIGKTTLLGTVIDHGRSLGATVAVGTCSTSAAAPAFYPWTQILRALQRAVGNDVFTDTMESAGIDLTDPMRIATLASPDASAGAGRSEREFALLDSLAAALAAPSHRAPLVVAIEDLHWADRLSIDLLDFLARHVWFEQILIVATYRDTEVDGSDDPVHRRILDLPNNSGRLQVPGLEVDDVKALVRQVGGDEPPAEFVKDLHRRSGGNPFFVEQTARLWAAGHGDGTIAPGVADAVRRRLDRVPPASLELLQAAAVLTVPVDYPMLAAVVSGANGGDLPGGRSGALAAALSARLLRGTAAGTYEFVHELVRETLLADIDPEHSRRLHAAVVAALPDHPETILPGQAADHAVRAGDLVETERAVDLLVAAGRDANSHMQSEVAIEFYRQAAALTTDPDRRNLIRLDQGSEMLFFASWNKEQTGPAEEVLREVIAHAGRPEGDPAIAARVAVELSGVDAVRDPAGELLLHAAMRLLTTVPEGTEAIRDALTEHMAQVARAGDDDDTLTSMLTARHSSLWRPGTAPERQQIMAELQLSARRNGDRDLEQFAASMLWVCMVEQNDPEYLNQYQSFAALAARYPIQRLSLGSDIDGAVLAAFRGRFDESAQRIAALSERIPVRDPYIWMVRYLEWSNHLRRGEWEQSAQLANSFQRSELDRRVLRAIDAAESGDVTQAITHLDTGVADAHGNDQISYPALHDRALALIAAGTADPGRIEKARARLEPLRGTWSVDLYGMDLGGPIDFYLGIVEAAAGRTERAAHLLRCAIAAADHMSSGYWAARSRIELLGLLDPASAEYRSVRERVDAALPDIDARLLHERLGTLTANAPRAAEQSAPTPTRPAAAGTSPEFRRDGAVWHLAWDGSTAALPEAKGLVDLHTLLSNPGVDIASTTLLNPGSDEQSAEMVAARSGGDPVVDDTAREQYRARLQRLDDLLDEAGADGRTSRRDELLAEREALISELRAATGLGGRRRRLGDNAERARKTVSARIRDTLRRIDEAHPALANHLRTAVRTGSSCRYDPEEPVRWRLN